MKFIPKKDQSAFTLVELMISTTIFSLILVLGLTGFVQVGKVYYKGVSIGQTQETAKQILDDVSSNLRLASSFSGPTDAGQGRMYYCIGGHRYSFMQYQLVDSSSNYTNNFGLIEDVLPGNGCGNPFAGSGGVPLVNPSEALGSQMRLLNFTILSLASGSNGTLYEVDITLAYGQDSALTSTSDPNAQCKLQLSGNDFCAITKLTTTVYEGSI